MLSRKPIYHVVLDLGREENRSDFPQTRFSQILRLLNRIQNAAFLRLLVIIAIEDFAKTEFHSLIIQRNAKFVFPVGWDHSVMRHTEGIRIMKVTLRVRRVGGIPFFVIKSQSVNRLPLHPMMTDFPVQVGWQIYFQTNAPFVHGLLFSKGHIAIKAPAFMDLHHFCLLPRELACQDRAILGGKDIFATKAYVCMAIEYYHLAQ